MKIMKSILKVSYKSLYTWLRKNRKMMARKIKRNDMNSLTVYYSIYYWYLPILAEAECIIYQL